jgi:hypothetical protein
VLQRYYTINQDVEGHKASLNELKRATQSVLDIVDKYHNPALKGRLDEVAEWFNTLRFNARSYAVQTWLEDKEIQLGNIARVNYIIMPVHVSSVLCVYTYQLIIISHADS